MMLRNLYGRAADALLLRRLEDADSACEEAIVLWQNSEEHAPLAHADWSRKLWLLRIAITTAQLEELPELAAEIIPTLMERVKSSNGGCQDIHPATVAALEMLALRMDQPNQARLLAEQWLSALSDETYQAVVRANTQLAASMVDESTVLVDVHPPPTSADASAASHEKCTEDTVHLSDTTGDALSSSVESAAQDRQLATGYERVVELYALHVLPALGEWETASEFLAYNDMLHEAKRKVYAKALRKLRRAARKQRQQEQKSPQPDVSVLEGSETLEESSLFASAWIEAGEPQHNKLQHEADVSAAGSAFSTSTSHASSSSGSPASSASAVRSKAARAATSPEAAEDRSPSHDSSLVARTINYVHRLLRQLQLQHAHSTSPYTLGNWLVVLLMMLLIARLGQRQPYIRSLFGSLWQKFLQTLRMGTTVSYV